MNFLNKFCWICLKKENIFNLYDKDKDGMTYIDKFATTLVGMDFKDLSKLIFICEECCTILNTVYNFQQTCLRSKAYLISYISQLQSISEASNQSSTARPTDIQVEIKTEKHNTNEETGDESTIWILEDSDSDQDDSYTSMTIKNEYENEENAQESLTSNLFENDKSIDIKKEEIEGANTSENGFQNYEDSFIEEETENSNLVEDSGFENYKDHIFYDPRGYPVETDTNVSESVPVTPQDGSTNLIAYGDLYNSNGNSLDKSSENIFYNRNYAYKTKRKYKRNYPCEICKKRFTKKCNLDVHRRVHSGEKPFECDICKKTFKQRTHLDVHIRTHSGEKPFECEICNKKFTQKWYLDVHKRSHTGERPYECVICKKGFIHSTILNIHMRTHSLERPYECVVCKRRFSLKGNYTVHMRIHASSSTNHYTNTYWPNNI